MAGVHHRDAVAEAQRLVDVVADVEHGAVERVEQAHQVLLEHLLEVRVQRAERLVEHQDARARRQHARERHALLLAAGQLAGIAPVEPLQAEAFQLAGHDGRAISLRHVLADARRHVLRHREVGKQHVVLEQQRRLALLRREVDASVGVEEHLPVHDDAPLVGRFDAGDAAHREAFAAARRSQKAQRLGAGLDAHVERERPEALFDVDFQTHTLVLRTAAVLGGAPAP